MTPRQARFVAEYLIDLNATAACLRAGYSPRGAAQAAERLLRNVEVAAEVAKKTQRQLAKADLSAARTLEEMRRLAFSNVRSLFDDRGNLRPIQDLTEEEAACIASIEVIIKNAQAGDGHTDTVHRIKVWDKPRTLEMLGKHFALLVERVKLDADEALIEALLRGRKRASGR